ncbi:MAG: multiheme c-type cytochrome [Planctomycetota bacterium]
MPKHTLRLIFCFGGLICLQAFASAQGLPDGPLWGRGREPDGANSVFATSDGCALCHSATDRATAMRDKAGNDISPYHLWQTSMMANAFRDPYWRAQVSKATLAHPKQAADIEKLCTTCHAPMMSHTARIAGFASFSIHEIEGMALAEDGVSCMVCHMAQPDNLGKVESFNGKLDIRPGRTIFGPYPEPFAMPMRIFAAARVTQGKHIQSSAMCGSCHTLETHHAVGAEGFQEQTPYLEWLNSDFADGAKDAKSCQECHMTNYGTTRIARAPHRGDFNIPPRPNYRGHNFYGGNAYMLDIFAANRETLDVKASSAALNAAAQATRDQLASSTAQVTLLNTRVEKGRLKFDVQIENKTGHKLPSGYPSRRIWLSLEIRDGNKRFFMSGAYDDRGRLVGVKDPLALAHVDTVTKAEQIPVWETVVLDAKGKTTTELVAMARYGKDNRLLPRGWKKDGAFAKRTTPVGIGTDKDFRDGSDTVHYDLDLKKHSGKGLVITAKLHYQTIPPAWALDLVDVPTKEAKIFNDIYKKMPTKTEILSSDTKTLK